MGENIPTTYKKTWLSEFFHSFPHWNRHMKGVSSEFDPEDDQYRESLLFWALLPVAFCVLLWIFFFVFFVCRCCDKPAKPNKNPSVCPRLTTGLFIFLTLGLLGFGLYENEEAERGVDQFRGAVIQINTTVGGAVDRIDSLDSMASDISGPYSDAIVHVVLNFSNEALKREIMLLVNRIRKQTDDAQAKLKAVDLLGEFKYLSDIINISNDVEYYRWAGSIIVCCMYIFIFFLALIGLLMGSRTLLILSTTLCVFCMVFLWSFAGAHLGTSVGLGDFCVDPNGYVKSLSKDPVKKEIIEDYVECTNNTEPYGDEIQGAIKSLTQAQLILEGMEKLLNPLESKMLSKPFADMKNDLTYSMTNLSILLDNVGICTNIHGNYEDAVDGACVGTLTSIAWITLVGCVVGLFCCFATVSNSVLWRQYSKKRLPSNYNQVDDTDPFLPRPPPYESDYGAVGYSSPTPWSERGTLQRYNTDSPYSDESLMMLPHTQRHPAPLPVDESPPPALSGNSVEFKNRLIWFIEITTPDGSSGSMQPLKTTNIDDDDDRIMQFLPV